MTLDLRLTHLLSSSTKLLLFPLLVVFILLYGCNRSESPNSQGTPPYREPSSRTLDSSSQPPPTAINIDLQAIIGTTQEVWLPKAISDFGLERSMTPETVGQFLSGAEGVSNLGDDDRVVISEVSVQNVPGLQKYEFIFQKYEDSNQHWLYSITLVFDPFLKTALSYEELANAFARKYGNLEPEFLEQKKVFWIGPSFATASLTDYGTDFEGYKFEIVLPDY